MKTTARLTFLLLVGPCALSSLALAAAPDGAAVRSPDPQVDAARTITFDIRAQPLATALIAFSTRTNIQVLTSGADLAGIRTSGASGRLTSSAALERLLDGSGFTYRFVDAATVVLTRAAAPDVKATAPAAGASAAAHQLTNRRNDEGAPQEALEEVIVTATKRLERLQDVPTSISVLGGESLERLGATNLTQYAAYAPGLSVDTLGNPGEARLTLRGIPPIGSGTAVGTYLGDVPVGSSTQHAGGSVLALDLLPYDLARIEVLRGPQGTLYGASTMGGLLKYVTVAPDLAQFEARVGLESFGVKGASDAGLGGRAGLNVPLVDGQLGLRLGLFDMHTPGYIDNPVTGKRDINDVTQKGGHAALLWKPLDALDVKLEALVQDIDTDDSTTIWRGPDLEDSLGDLSARYLLAQPFHQRIEIYSATANYDLGWASITSASSYQHSIHNVTFDESFFWAPFFSLLDPAAAPGLSRLEEDIAVRKYTQELRLTSATGGRVEWLVGAFYTRERAGITQDADATDAARAPIPSLNPFLSVDQHDAYEEYAAFGDLTYKITDRFDVTGGLRWSRNDQKFSDLTDGVFGNLILSSPPPVFNSGKSGESVKTYLVSPRFHFSPDLMLYARYATGYRPGGPNVGLAGIPPQVDSDTLKNYEVGFKSALLDKRLQLDFALFYIDWSGIQISKVDPTLNVSFNANGGTARSRGAELTTSYSPVRNLTIGFNASYVDATLTEDVPSLNGVDGDRLPYAPKWDASLTADYDMRVTPLWSAHFGGGYRYIGDRYSDVQSSPFALRSPSYTVLDLNASVSNDRWTFRLYGRNLTDERAYLSPSAVTDPLTGAPDHTETTILQPRTIGVSADVRF